MKRLRTITLACVLAAACGLPAPALGSWSHNGSGHAYSKAMSLPAGNTPTANVSNRDVAVSWTASTGGAPVSGYIVKRYNTSGTQQTIGAVCSGTIASTSCTESSVPSGTWNYSITPVNQNWRGTESAQSTSVTVSAASLTVSPTNITSLPTALSGSIANFIPGQTVTFRLDDPSTGTVLTGSITPSPVPVTGTSTVSVTIPSGTSNGSHTVYAIGSGSDTASAAITVAVPTTITTSGWDFRDASSGTEADVSDPFGFASDSRTAATTSFGNAFSATRFLDFDYNAPVGAGQTPSSVNFNFRFANSSVLSNACFYFETRTLSTNTVIATHGSAASPVGCVNNTNQTTFTTSLPEIDTVAEANDLRVRVYFSQSLITGGPVTLDHATVSGTAGGSTPFTLFENSWNDQANGAAATTPWELAATDSTLFTNGTNWTTTNTGTRYLKETFPAYVPSTATISSVTYTHAFRSNSSGQSVCYFFDVLAGSTVIGSHGTSVAPVNCNSSNSTDVTDTVSLPEVTTAAQANSLSVKLYYRTASGSLKTEDNRGAVTITYVR